MAEPQELRDDGNWLKSPLGGFVIGDPFESIQAEMEYEIDDVDLSKDTMTQTGIANMINAIVEDAALSDETTTAPGVVDTTPGGNEAMNALWGFGIDDDIIWPSHEIPREQGTAAGSIDYNSIPGMGRVYSETYNDNQHILWLSMGTPRFSSLKEFYASSTNSKLASIMSGSGSISYKLGAILGKGVEVAIKLPFYPLIAIHNLVKNGVKNITSIQVNKYYEMVPRMDLYYKSVIILLSHLSVGMGRSPDGSSDFSEKELTELLNNGGISPLLREGPDILYILATRERRRNANSVSSITADALETSSTASEIKDMAWNWLTDPAMSKYQFIGFRIEKGSDFSETVSNSTGKAEIDGKLNGAVSAAKEKNFSVAGGKITGGIGNLMDSVKGFVNEMADGLNLGAINLTAQGSGFFDIPEVWQNSSFSRSYSFDIQLRSRYGTPDAIFQSIYIPLCLLIAAAFPIGVGKNNYTSPFLIQAYSRGLFSIPTGIIESMTIKRGLPEYGWTGDNLPIAVDVSLNIKDLSPTIFLSMYDANLIALAADKLSGNLSSNESMKLYMATLAGMSIGDITHKKTMFEKRWKALLMINKNVMLNPAYHSMAGSTTRFQRFRAQLSSRSAWKVPDG